MATRSEPTQPLNPTLRPTMTPVSTSAVLDALHWRYATKAFDPQRAIPGDLWNTLVESVVLAPSSFGLQPYRLRVVDSPAVREALLPHAWGQRQIVDAARLVVFAARTEVTPADLDDYVARLAAVRGIPVASLAGLRDMMAGMLLAEGFKPLQRHWTARQAYLGLGALLETAALLGVDACPMEGFVPAEFDRILNLPAEGLTAVVVCALGYRSPSDKYATLPKVRFDPREWVKSL